MDSVTNFMHLGYKPSIVQSLQNICKSSKDWRVKNQGNLDKIQDFGSTGTRLEGFNGAKGKLQV